jgi:hypothetical protein
MLINLCMVMSYGYSLERLAPCEGYAVARTTMDASILKTRESFMFELRGATRTLSMLYIGIFKRVLYLFAGPLIA